MKLTLAGKVKDEQLERAGTYILSDGLVNGYPHWLLKTDGSQVIWFHKDISSWCVTPKEYLGSSAGFIAGPRGKDSYPNEIKQGWEYCDNGWHDAGPNDVIFKAIGTFIKPLLYKINHTATGGMIQVGVIGPLTYPNLSEFIASKVQETSKIS